MDAKEVEQIYLSVKAVIEGTRDMLDRVDGRMPRPPEGDYVAVVKDAGIRRKDGVDLAYFSMELTDGAGAKFSYTDRHHLNPHDLPCAPEEAEYIFGILVHRFSEFATALNCGQLIDTDQAIGKSLRVSLGDGFVRRYSPMEAA